MMKKLLYILTIFIAFTSNAQQGYDWGQSKVKAQPKYVFIQLNYQKPNFMECRTRIQWLVNNAPNVHKDLYVMGAEVYNKAVGVAGTEEEKLAFQDSALFMYNEQISRFGLKADGYNYMGLVAYSYLSTREGQWEKLGYIYNSIVEVNDTNTFVANIYTYLATNCVLLQLEKNTEEDLYAKYQKALQLIQYNKGLHASNQEMITYLDQTEVNCETLFKQYFTVDCNSITKLYDFDNLTVEEANKSLEVMNINGCTDSDNYNKVIEFLYIKEPTMPIVISLANIYAKESIHKALPLYKQVLQSEADASIKGQVSYTLMNYYLNKGNKNSTREYARKNIALNYQVAKSHTVIGNLYYNSLNQVRDDKDIVKTRSIYIAAYNEYKLAGNQAKMTQAKQQFPSVEEVFRGGYKVGQTINTGHWINENVVLQTR